MVYRRRRPLEEAIAELNLKKTTAVNIIKKFKETGSLPMRKFKRTRKIGRKNHREIIPDVS
jgi:transposase